MKIAVLDECQNCARSLNCFEVLERHQVKVFTNSARGIGQLAIRLADFDVLVLIGRRTYFPKALLDNLPKLKTSLAAILLIWASSREMSERHKR